MLSDYARIERAIQYLEDNFRNQPSLEVVAEQLNLSPYHFQRLFKRWAGISPKRFLQFLTIDYAKRLLDESRDVLDVTYAAGLSSPGRMHDLFVSIDAVTIRLTFRRFGRGGSSRHARGSDIHWIRRIIIPYQSIRNQPQREEEE